MEPKTGGVYYTPTYIVDYIVKNTVGKLLEEGTKARSQEGTKGVKKDMEGVRECTDASSPVPPLRASAPSSLRASPIKILDPACGSGSFLLGAYQYLLDWYLDAYTRSDPAALATGKNPVLRPAPALSPLAPREGPGEGAGNLRNASTES